MLRLFTLIISLSLLFTACSGPNSLDKTKKDQTSIINGKPVMATDPLSSQVVMIAQDIDFTTNKEPLFFGLCSGVLIKPQIVLTAAHCLNNGIKTMRVIHHPNPRSLSQDSSYIYKPLDFRIHPDFKTTKSKSIIELAEATDLALLFLDRAANLQNFQEIKFEKMAQAHPHLLVLAGFGKTSDQASGELYRAEATLLAEESSHLYFTLDQSKEGGVCKGDSGGPVFIKGTGHSQLSLFALAINVFKKNSEQPLLNRSSICAHSGLYLKLEPHQKWIQDSIDELIPNSF